MHTHHNISNQLVKEIYFCHVFGKKFTKGLPRVYQGFTFKVTGQGYSACTLNMISQTFDHNELNIALL